MDQAMRLLPCDVVTFSRSVLKTPTRPAKCDCLSIESKSTLPHSGYVHCMPTWGLQVRAGPLEALGVDR